MRACLFVVMSAQLLAGCGAAAVRHSPTQIDFAVRDITAPRVGEAQVLAKRVSPMQPLAAEATADGVAITYARRGQQGSVLLLDAQSLAPRSAAQYAYASRGGTLSSAPMQIGLADGGSLALWTEGTLEWGRRAVAQWLDGDGKPRRPPVVLSPPAMDVVGAPAGATIDGHRVVATFYAAEGDAFELVAVSIEDM